MQDSTNPNPVWRLILSAPARGGWNMALDEAILESCILVDQAPTLRLYAWYPACLSLGIAQPCADVDSSALHALGWELVRRPTGGRAILHTDELTYAVMGRSHDPTLTGSVLESYQRLSGALLAALRLLGAPAAALEQPAPNRIAQNAGPVCFQVPSNYEITAGGKKLIGSAQARRKNGVLQHGSLPLWGDLTRITQVLRYPSPAARVDDACRLLEHATTIEMVLGIPVPWETAARAFVRGFEQVFAIRLEESSPTSVELNRATELYETKYATAGWTERI
ncbi:MAG: biotin/lipoate A/B protein ligase family protein [Anaerolineaceae bacterium]|nr:biotin/lipoate A/B protein ligase family protein [Anaerolineaceae bacterium]